MISVAMLSVITLSVISLSVVAPFSSVIVTKKLVSDAAAKIFQSVCLCQIFCGLG